MSLKSRIEALVYAAEEPVTLAQLASLLTEEAESHLAAISAAESSAQLAEPPAESAGESVAEPAAEPTTAEATPEAAVELSPEAAAEAEKKAARDKEKQRERRIRDLLRAQVQELIADYANNERGMEIREVAGGYRMSTKPEYHDTIRAFVKSLKPPLKLSLQALETLAVIAYKQPVTAPEISEIRGVDTSGVLGSLISRKLITTAGRKQVIGRPILYKTTRDFLLRFGLKDISELPSIEEFEKLAGELTEADESPETQAAEAVVLDAELAAAGPAPEESGVE